MYLAQFSFIITKTLDSVSVSIVYAQGCWLPYLANMATIKKNTIVVFTKYFQPRANGVDEWQWGIARCKLSLIIWWMDADCTLEFGLQKLAHSPSSLQVFREASAGNKSHNAVRRPEPLEVRSRARRSLQTYVDQNEAFWRNQPEMNQ